MLEIAGGLPGIVAGRRPGSSGDGGHSPGNLAVSVPVPDTPVAEPRGAPEPMAEDRQVKRELALGSTPVEPPEKKEKRVDFYIGTPAAPDEKKTKTAANVDKEWTPDEDPFWDDSWCEDEFGTKTELTEDMRRAGRAKELQAMDDFDLYEVVEGDGCDKSCYVSGRWEET